MKHTETITKHTCDICENECQPLKEITIPIGHYPGGESADIKAMIYLDIPYAPSGDICTDCVKKYLKEWVNNKDKSCN